MSASAWNELTKVEKELMVCAMEAGGILPCACGATDDSGSAVTDGGRAAVVLSLVDRGWVQVCRLEPWTASDGRDGVRHGEPIDRGALLALLADPDVWDDPADQSWIGEVALIQTEAWRRRVAGG